MTPVTLLLLIVCMCWSHVMSAPVEESG